MNSISVKYVLEWRLKNNPNYQLTKCGRMFNIKTGKQITKVLNSRCVGFWIGREFKSANTLRNHLEKIPKETCPF